MSPINSPLLQATQVLAAAVVGKILPGKWGRKFWEGDIYHSRRGGLWKGRKMSSISESESEGPHAGGGMLEVQEHRPSSGAKHHSYRGKHSLEAG